MTTEEFRVDSLDGIRKLVIPENSSTPLGSPERLAEIHRGIIDAIVDALAVDVDVCMKRLDAIEAEMKK